MAQGAQGTSAAQRPAFRSGVDLIAVDIQVIDKDGHPVAGLGPDAFDVTIDGKKRRVASADFVTYGRPSHLDPGTTIALAPPPTVVEPAAPQPPQGPAIILAFDCLSFDFTATLGIVRTAKAFVNRLGPAERVGLFAYPIGFQLEPTTDHAAVLKAIDQVKGQYEAPPGFTNGTRPRPQEIVDGSAYCPSLPCLPSIFEEGQINTSLSILGSFVRGLKDLPGRKILLLVSAGMVVADRPGYRPDIGDLAIVAGKDAAAANVTVYSLFVDQSLLSQMSAERSTAPNPRLPIARDSEILGRYLDQFSSAAGGTMFKALTGDGEVAFDRLLEETSAYYLLGVEPADSDRDGRPHELKVKSSTRGVTVRGRSWVVVSKK